MKQFLRLPRREVLLVTGAAVVAFAITLGIMGASVRSRSRRTQEAQRTEAARSKKPPALSAEEMTPSPEDFLLPDLRPPLRESVYVPYRPRIQRWDAQVAGAYWVAPRQIARIASIPTQKIGGDWNWRATR